MSNQPEVDVDAVDVVVAPDAADTVAVVLAAEADVAVNAAAAAAAVVVDAAGSLEFFYPSPKNFYQRTGLRILV